MEISTLVADHCNLSQGSVKVRNLKEQEEEELNNANAEATGESLLAKEELEEVDGQKLVGDKHNMSLLKELHKNRKELTQYKGVNDKILAKKVPAEKSGKAEKTPLSKSVLGSKGK
jgi:hypothetical protein